LYPVKGTDDIRTIESGSPVSFRSEDVAINVDEHVPLIGRDQYITIDIVSSFSSLLYNNNN
jgi:hypothetical protein